MKFVFVSGSFLLLLFAGRSISAPAQASSQDNFETLSRRAAAALDTQPGEAVQLYQRALKLHPVWPEGWFYLGASEYQLKHFPQATIAFSQAVELAPQNGPARAFLGLAEYQLREFDKSLTDLQRGTSLGTEGNPRFSSDVHTHLAVLLSRQAHFGPALEQLEPLAKAGDNSEPVITAFGLAVLQQSLLPPDIPADKRSVVEGAGRAVWSFYAEKPDEAQALFEQLVKEHGSERGVHYAYAMSLVPRDPDLALGELRRELGINPNHLYACVEAALLEMKRGEFGESLKLAARGVQLGPDYSLAHAALGRALLKAGQSEKAMSELETAIRLAPQDALLHFYLEQAYLRAGRNADAEKEKAEYYRLKASATVPLGGMQPQIGGELSRPR